MLLPHLDSVGWLLASTGDLNGLKVGLAPHHSHTLIVVLADGASGVAAPQSQHL